MRVEGDAVQRVTVLPVYSRVGRIGAPPPDEAKLVPGETNLYSAALWLMKPGWIRKLMGAKSISHLGEYASCTRVL